MRLTVRQERQNTQSKEAILISEGKDLRGKGIIVRKTKHLRNINTRIIFCDLVEDGKHHIRTRDYVDYHPEAIPCLEV